VGGNAGEVNLNTRTCHNPKTDVWRMISTHHAPSARKLHTTIWTGEVMVIWGGEGNGGNPTDWGTYNPATDTWRKTKPAAEPKPRTNHTMVWTGQELILTGGLAENGDLLPDLWKGKLPPQ
jgi:N-acetylneuraminic acid mutarotase